MSSTIYHAISTKSKIWVELEKQNNQSVIKTILSHIEQQAKLRPPQVEAISAYLWLKFVGQNRKLSEMVKEGLFYDDDTAREYDNYHTFTNRENEYVTQFLNQFFQDNDLRNQNIHRQLINDPDGGNTNWNELLDELLHDFTYSNYLFSLPMGAGKTFLMACFIYIDLYFAMLFRNDKRFAHNFVVFAPHSAKTAILPSLRTIRDFNPEWILPTSDAEKIRQLVTIEILDSLSSNRRDKLHGENPNLEKVNRLRQTREFGLVFITNAEKVVLERYDAIDQRMLDQEDFFYDKKKADEVSKTNHLREALSQIPYLTVILDEVHHSYGGSGNGQKKLRQAVYILNQYGNVTSVVGLSGTPYVRSRINIGNADIRLNQIQDIVYHYPLNAGIGTFLKQPKVKRADVTERAFIRRALDEFFSSYDKKYKGSTQSKIAFYCPTIASLNKDILPVIRDWYTEYRPGREQEIFKYYTNVTKDNKQYALPKNSLSIFHSLDKPYSKKRVVLLVAVGTEGWDCKSLTAVVLPRQKTSKNFVLQTTCRCLREVDNAANERALIYLSADNYQTLDKELRENYRLTISDLTFESTNTVKVVVRKPKLGRLKYKQVEYRSNIVSRTSPDKRQALAEFNFSKIKERYRYDTSITSGTIEADRLADKISEPTATMAGELLFSFTDFLYRLATATWGMLSECELERSYRVELEKTYNAIVREWNWIDPNPNLDIDEIIRIIAASLMDRVEYSRDVIEQETEIELLEWEGDENHMTVISPNGAVYKFLPRLRKNDINMYRKYPQEMDEMARSLDSQDIGFNYVPYKLDSAFEQSALTEMLKLVELKNLEVYFNGYRDKNLESFWIQTPRGRYTPDFLILKRKEGRKYHAGKQVVVDRALIIETKGAPYYNDEFKAKEKFVRDTFLQHNSHLHYHCFTDYGNSKFEEHLDKFREILSRFVS